MGAASFAGKTCADCECSGIDHFESESGLGDFCVTSAAAPSVASFVLYRKHVYAAATTMTHV